MKGLKQRHLSNPKGPMTIKAKSVSGATMKAADKIDGKKAVKVRSPDELKFGKLTTKKPALDDKPMRHKGAIAKKLKDVKL